MRHPSKRAFSIIVTVSVLSLTTAASTPAVPPASRSDAANARYDARLDLAQQALEKAVALLQAAENPTAKNPDRPFGGHREKAIRNLEKALDDIEAAKAYADASN